MNTVFDFAEFPTAFISVDNGQLSGGSGYKGDFSGTITYGRDLNTIFELQNPDPDAVLDYQPNDSFLADINFWERKRSINDHALLDRRPNVLTGRRGALFAFFETDKFWDTFSLQKSSFHTAFIFQTTQAIAQSGNISSAINTINSARISSQARLLTINPDVRNEVTDTLDFDLEWYLSMQSGKAYFCVVLSQDENLTAITATNRAIGELVVYNGQVVLGMRKVIGESINLENWSLRKVDQSPKAVDDFGNLNVTPRGSTYDSEMAAEFPELQAQNVKRMLDDLLPAKAALFWREVDVRKGTLVYGYLDDHDFSIGNLSDQDRTLIADLKLKGNI